MNDMNKETEELFELLRVIEPGEAEAPQPSHLALAQLKRRMDEESQQTWHYRLTSFWNVPERRYAATAVLAALLLVFAFSFPGVRSAAADFLSLFRVQNFAAITISPEQISLLNSIAEQGLMPGEIVIDDEPGELTPADSVAEAAAMTGMTAVRTLAGLGEPDGIYVASGGSGHFIIDVEGSRAILEAVGVDPMLLGDELDGTQVNVVAFAGIDQQWDEDLHLLQSESPLVEYPDGLQTDVLGQAVLQVLGLNEAEAARLSEDIDWTSTLLLPIPQDVATYHEVTVDGVSGIAVADLDGRAATILWQKDGIIYTLFGDRTVEELVEITNSLE